MKNLILLLSLCYSAISSGQEHHISTEIKAENVFDLSIINVYPDSFPEVSVIFQAKNEFGKPLWQLDKSDIVVTENQENCLVTRLINISKDKPVNIGLVFDHSGSMVDNPAQLPEGTGSLQDRYFSGVDMPKDYKMAIEFAKEGVLGFLDETTVSNDSILFVGFSSQVDKVVPLTNEIGKIKSFMKDVEPSGSTSFYDALYYSLTELSSCKNKSVIVALTDGLDNNSTHTYEEMIDLAQAKNINIYTIGLGNADSKTLQSISNKTDGFHYYTNDPQKLKEIYLNIKEQIKSIYQLDYTSGNLMPEEEDRKMYFSFTNDTLEFSSHSSFYSLPEETIHYLKKKEEERKNKERLNLTYLGLGILVLGIGAFAVYRRKKKNSELKITKAYPNPFTSSVSFEFKISSNDSKVELTISDFNGRLVFTKEILSKHLQETIALNELSPGIYYAQLIGSSFSSNVIKLIKE